MQCSAAYEIWSSIMEIALTHWGPDKTAAILADDIIKGIFCMELIEFNLKFRRNLFPRVRLTIKQHWFK